MNIAPITTASETIKAKITYFCFPRRTFEDLQQKVALCNASIGSGAFSSITSGPHEFFEHTGILNLSTWASRRIEFLDNTA
jgi:hypothetical protein